MRAHVTLGRRLASSLRSEQLLTPTVGTLRSPCAPSDPCRGWLKVHLCFPRHMGDRNLVRRCKLGARGDRERFRGGVESRTERPRSVASESGPGPATSKRVGIGGLCPTIRIVGGLGNPSRVPIRIAGRVRPQKPSVPWPRPRGRWHASTSRVGLGGLCPTSSCAGGLEALWGSITNDPLPGKPPAKPSAALPYSSRSNMDSP
jgi:hypothetical protein